MMMVVLVFVVVLMLVVGYRLAHGELCHPAKVGVGCCVQTAPKPSFENHTSLSVPALPAPAIMKIVLLMGMAHVVISDRAAQIDVPTLDAYHVIPELLEKSTLWM
jgi:hypothetical protein